MPKITCDGCYATHEIPEVTASTRYQCGNCEILFDVELDRRGVVNTVFHHGGEVLCLDFGTSSLRAGLRTNALSDAIALELGKSVSSSIDDASIPSAVFVTKEGDLIFFGEEAFDKNSRNEPCMLSELSPKRWMTEGEDLDREPIPGIGITKKQLLAGLLAQALSAAAVASRIPAARFQSIEIRVSHPVWNNSKAPKLKVALSEILAMARSLLGEIGSSVSPSELRTLCDEVRAPMGTPIIDVIEPIAAAIELFANSESARQICVVVDVGAGTTDLAMFLSSTPDSAARGHLRKLKPIARPRSIYLAGDTIDSAVLALIVAKAGITLASEAWGDINRRRRTIKESLFAAGVVRHGGVDVHLAELEKQPKIEELCARLDSEFQSLVAEAAGMIRDRYRATNHPVNHLDVIFAGGGADIAFLKKAIGDSIQIEPGLRVPIVFKKAAPKGVGELPAALERLAVALGGTTAEADWPKTEMSEARHLSLG